MAQQFTYHMEIDEGTDYTQVFTIVDSDTGIVQNLTGYSARMDVRGIDYNSQSSTLIPISFNSATSTSTHGITLGGVLGTVTVNLLASDTLTGGWNGGTNGTYDIFLISSTGVKTKAIKGFFTIKPSSTKLV